MTLTVFFLLILVFPKQAHAYLDPGTNSYLFQIALASLLGGILTVKLYFKKITAFFKHILFKNAKPEKTTK